jgi:hypothetical protein
MTTHVSLDVVGLVATAIPVSASVSYIAIATQFMPGVIGLIPIVMAIATLCTSWASISYNITTATNLVPVVIHLIVTTAPSYTIHNEVAMTAGMGPGIKRLLSTALIKFWISIHYTPIAAHLLFDVNSLLSAASRGASHCSWVDFPIAASIPQRVPNKIPAWQRFIPSTINPRALCHIVPIRIDTDRFSWIIRY